jgi:hypothetical protein
MPLSDAQLRAVEVLDWLFDRGQVNLAEESLGNGPRATGRTFAWAVALIRLAVRSPRLWVYYSDHLEVIVPTQNIRQITSTFVEDLVASDPRLAPFMEARRDRFRLNLEAPILDWMPPDGEIPERVRNWRIQVHMSNGSSRMDGTSTSEASRRLRGALDDLRSVLVKPKPKTLWERLEED